MIFCFSLCTELSFCLIPLSNLDRSWNRYPFVFPVSVPFDLGVRMCPIKTQSLRFPWIGVPRWLLSHQGFGDTMLCFLVCYCWLFWTPAQLPYEQAQLTCWKKRDHVGQRKFSSTGDPRPASSQATCFLKMLEQNSVVTTQLNLVQLSDH